MLREIFISPSHFRFLGMERTCFFFFVLELDSLERDITFRVQLWKIIIEYKNSFNNKFRKFDRRVFFNIYLKVLKQRKNV